VRLRLRGKLWRLLITKDTLGTAKGSCEAPTLPNKAIRIRPSLKGRQELDTYIHEMLHACLWDLDEEAITDSATDIARALWRLGYRKTTE